VSDPKQRRNIPSPNEAKGPIYGRFIPAEEMASFETWTPGSVHDRRKPAAPPPPAPPPPPAGPTPAEVAAAMRSMRQSGYQDGYRDGLAALDAFKQTYAAQMTAQLGALVAAHDEQLSALHAPMAEALAKCATALARQVVRSELAAHPQRVAEVAREAIEALLLSARHVTVRVHPDDLPLVTQGAGEALEARGARLLEDASLTRGGCRVDSDIGGVDATIETRWKNSVGAIGSHALWDEPNEAAP